LKRNIFLNLLGCEISTQQVAVGESDELVALTFPYGRPFSSGAKISQEFENKNSNHYDTQTDIQMVTLDSLIKTTNEEVVVLKIDAEGFELQILKGATHLLATNFPQIIVEILSDQQKVEVDQFLQNFGYKKGVPIQDSAKTSNMLYMIN
jgi:FkbM family methyltransferase